MATISASSHLFKTNYYSYINRPCLFRSAVERSSIKQYHRPLPYKQGPYLVRNLDEDMLRIRQNNLKNSFSVHSAILAAIVVGSSDQSRLKTDEPY